MEHDNETIDPEGFLLVSQSWNSSKFTGKVKYPDRNKIWYKNGRLHREDGPAVVWADGSKHWYNHSQHHREDGPAVELANGNRWWYKEGLLHREDGPAVEIFDGDGHVEWWYEGRKGIENFPPELKKKLTRRFLHGT